MTIQDNPRIDVATICEIAHEAVTKDEVGLVVVDGLQCLGRAEPKENRYVEVCDDVHELKRLARELNVALVVTSALNRDADKRADKRPWLADLRNAGDIEDVADNVVLIHRDDQYDVEYRPGEADLILG